MTLPVGYIASIQSLWLAWIWYRCSVGIYSACFMKINTKYACYLHQPRSNYHGTLPLPFCYYYICWVERTKALKWLTAQDSVLDWLCWELFVLFGYLSVHTLFSWYWQFCRVDINSVLQAKVSMIVHHTDH